MRMLSRLPLSLIFLLWTLLLAAQPPNAVQRITQSGRASGDVAISPDGKLVAFTADENGRTLWIRDLAAAKDRKVGFGSAHSLAFAPDGKSIYLLRSPRDGYNELFSSKLDGTDVKLMVKDVDSSIAFSPDGASIAFLRNVPAEGKLHLRISTAGKERDVASWSIGYGQATELAWSPDGKEIVFADHTRLLFVSVANATTKEVQSDGLIYGLAWPRTPSSGLIVLKGGKTRVNAFQLWRYIPATGAWTEIVHHELGFRPSQISCNADGSLLVATQTIKEKTGVEDLLSWVGLGDAGIRSSPNVVLVKLPAQATLANH